MISKILQNARDYEAKHRPRIAPQLPYYHITGGVGWINDPHGWAPYKGEYHLTFQYHPYNRQWGPMHWGHVKTKDFIKWEVLPCALAPDMEYDKDGCFTGAAVEMLDGRHLLMYTGVERIDIGDGKLEDRQRQCLAIGDGLDYEKYEGNPVLTGEDVPEGHSIVDFRDPKMWIEGDTYYVVTVNRGPDGSGTILLYESKDGLHWKYNGTIARNEWRYGIMWECADFFHMDGKDVILNSAQDLLAEGLEFHAGNSTLFQIGHLDREKWEFQEESIRSAEYGLDFYAPQTLETYDGRRVMIGWMQSWESSRELHEGLDFMGQMTIPRELKIIDGRVCQLPVRELENYRGECVSHKGVKIQEETLLDGINGRCIDMTLDITFDSENPCDRFELKFASDERFFSTITLRPQKGYILLDRTYSGFRHDVVTTRKVPVDFGGKIKLRLLLDRYSAELFVNEGQQAASMVIYTPETAAGICMKADKAVMVDVVKYDLKI